jgi:hypothetical protein
MPDFASDMQNWATGKPRSLMYGMDITNPDHVGKLILGGGQEREAITQMYGYKPALDTLNTWLGDTKDKLAAERDPKERQFLQNRHDSISGYIAELLGRQAM